MIKELIFNGKKFWQSESEPLIGKRIKAPRKPIYVYSEFHTFGGVDGTMTDLSKTATIEIQGFAKANNGLKGILISKGWIDFDDLIQNGGVSSNPLTHLYQGLRHLLDRKVALVND